jgi:hypothetical protein
MENPRHVLIALTIFALLFGLLGIFLLGLDLFL